VVLLYERSFQIKPHHDQPIPQIGDHVPDHPHLHEQVVGQVLQPEGALAEVAGAEQVEGFVHPLVPCAAEALLVELVILEQIAQRQREKVDDQHQQRLVLEREQDAVAAALLTLEGVVLDRTGAGSADVVALGSGAEDVFVARIVGPPAQVHILEVGEEVLVEAADLVQNALAVERRAAARREDPLLLGIAAGPAAIAGLAGKAHPCHIIARIVGQLPVKVADHQALHRKDLGVALSGPDQLGQPLRLGEGVVVEQHHEFALCPCNALIDCVGKPGVPPVFDQREVGAAAIAAGLFQTFVGGAVVHHDELEVLLGLGIDGLDGVLQPALAVDVGDDDGCFHKCAPAKFRFRGKYTIFAGEME